MNPAQNVLRHIRPDTVLPILTGPLRGTRWLAGAGRNAYWLGTYERAKCNAFARAIAQGDVVYDIGAHAGYYSLLASKRVGQQGHVYVFEPLPENVEYIEKHAELNQITNITIVRAAVSDQDGVSSFQRAPSRAMGQLGGKGDLQVRMLSLDRWVDATAQPSPRVVKMDVEGAELCALRGATRLLQRAAPSMFIATHSAELHQACRAFLVERGYQVEELEWLEREALGELVARTK